MLKKKIEEYIKEKTSRYLIIRTGNIVGHSNNSHTIFNFLFSKIKNSESFDLWLNASRNFLDIDHLVLMVNKTLEKGITNETIYLLNPLDIELSDIVMLFEEGLNKKAHYTKILKGNQIYTDKTFSTLLFKELNISVENYFKQLILKYCNEN